MLCFERSINMKRFIISSAAIAMSLAMAGTAVAAEGNSKYFADVTADNYGWAVEYIDYIASNGIASGVGNNMYAPASNIIRGDFAVLVNKTFTFREAKLETYALKDVSEDDYYAQAIANCCGAGVITERGMFYPENDITRIDAIVMIYRALSNNSLISGGLTTDVSMFTDGNLLTTVERQMAAATLNNLGIISGDDKGALNPNATMTRAEMAVVFAKLDQYIDKYQTEAAQKAEEEAQKAEEEAAKKEEEEQEQIKAEESRDYSGENIDTPISAGNGGAISVDNCTVSVTSDNAVSADNSSEIDISGTIVKSVGGNAVEAKNNSKINIKGGSATGTNGNGISAESGAEINVNGTDITANGNTPLYAVSAKGGEVNIEKSEITAADNKGAVVVGDGGTLNLSNSVVSAVTGTGKATYTGAIDVISSGRDESEITLENSTIDNSKGAAFYLRESDVTINIKGGNTINAAMLINSPEIVKEKQEYGNDINLNLTDGAHIQNTRIVIDTKTVLNIDIDDDCYLGGQIDTDVNGYINLNLSQNGVLELNSDIYLDGFINESDLDFNNIIDNGFNIYYNENNSDNNWLDMKEYDLVLGGKLVPYSKQPIVR